ncbi:hypothetical protein BF37_5776 (plasmid) [Bacillus anthracis]|nr:hypothetical protein BF37_5776 [Bacillus anthracis]
MNKIPRNIYFLISRKHIFAQNKYKFFIIHFVIFRDLRIEKNILCVVVIIYCIARFGNEWDFIYKFFIHSSLLKSPIVCFSLPCINSNKIIIINSPQLFYYSDLVCLFLVLCVNGRYDLLELFYWKISSYSLYFFVSRVFRYSPTFGNLNPDIEKGQSLKRCPCVR